MISRAKKRLQRYRKSVRLIRHGQQKGRCIWCGSKCRESNAPGVRYLRRRHPRGKKATVEHIAPRSAGGDERPANLVLACYACNVARGCDPTRLQPDEAVVRLLLKNGGADAVLTMLDVFLKEKGLGSTSPEPRAVRQSTGALSASLFDPFEASSVPHGTAQRNSPDEP